MLVKFCCPENNTEVIREYNENTSELEIDKDFKVWCHNIGVGIIYYWDYVHYDDDEEEECSICFIIIPKKILDENGGICQECAEEDL